MDYYYDHTVSYMLEALIDYRQSTAQLKNSAYWHMDQVYGWCSHSKGSILIDIIQKIQPATIVEIGVWGGKSLIPMAYALKMQGKGKIYGIDPWSSAESVVGMVEESNKVYWSVVDHEAAYFNLLTNLERFGLLDHVQLIRSTSANADPIFEIDLLHIDGNHSESSSYLDVTKWAPLVRKGGWIVVDDVSWFENGHFTQAESVAWLNKNCHKMGEISDTCIWGIWVK